MGSPVGDHGLTMNPPGRGQGMVIMRMQSGCSGVDSRKRTATEVMYDSGNGACHRGRGKVRGARRDEERQPAMGMQERENKMRFKKQSIGRRHSSTGSRE